MHQPTMPKKKTKKTFYEQLQATFNQLPKHDVKLLMGDLNAKVGADPSDFEDIMGSHGTGERETTTGYAY